MNPRYTKPADCHGCSLEYSGFGFALPSGPVGARLQFMGESLGYNEAVDGEPFVGAAGGTLSRVLIRAGVSRPQVRIGNTISCRPPGDFLVGAPYEEHAINQCRAYRDPFLAAIPDNAVLVPLGLTAALTVLNLRGTAGLNAKDIHGTVWRDPSDRFWVVPTFHPSHLQRGAMNLLEVVTQDIQLADSISQKGFARERTELVVDPHPDWFRKWVADYAAKVTADPESTHLAIDTEFLEKSGGVDESEVVLGAARSPITRINGACDRAVGWTVPWREPFISIAREMFAAVAAVRGWIWMWNKYADLDHLWAEGFAIPNELVIDAMWAWHYLQSDLPRGLGFVAPMASNFGAWKHWGKDPRREGPYAAADGVQTWRVSMWLLSAMQRQGIWEIFLRDWHERDVWALRPAFVQGVPANRPALEQFHAELQVKLGNVLTRLKETAAQGVLKPKGGYSARPKGQKCPACNGKGKVKEARPSADFEVGTYSCATCHGEKYVGDPTPPASILGKPKKGGGEAKSQYMTEGVRLVEKSVEVETLVCATCGAEDVGRKHRCPKPKRKKGAPVDGSPALVAEVRTVRKMGTRYFWQLPFNPDAPAQVLQYLADQGIEAPVDKKRRDSQGNAKKTTAKKELAALAKRYADDPFFQLQLDWKAVQKVDSTYAVGALSRLDKNDRLHPEFLPKPSTFRDSCVGINLQNVVADKAGPDGLASGFRRCIEARDGVPADRTEAEIAAWNARWGTT